MSPPSRVLIYLLRRDLRVADNPILHEISRSIQQSHHPYTHLLPLYVFAAQQIEVSGFIPEGSNASSPYPEARSGVAGFWRCGPHRAKFLAESVWDVKKGLEKLNSGLEIRAGMLGSTVSDLVEGFKKSGETEVVGVWMTQEEGVEEKREEREVQAIAQQEKIDFKLWTDEKYFIDDRDIPFQKPGQLPDTFTGYRKQVEPLRDAPRKTLPYPNKLPPFPAYVPAQTGPFETPGTLVKLIEALHRPLKTAEKVLSKEPKWPGSGAHSAHPFTGGESSGRARIEHLISTGCMTTYKDTRNGTVGPDFSTKLSAWLALGSITSRQVQQYLLDFEDGKGDLGRGAKGYGKGANSGTSHVRFELLWRDYFRLTTRKFGPRLFQITGFQGPKGKGGGGNWKSIDSDVTVQNTVGRLLAGESGNTFIDASMRELYLTGYTSNRLRQNVASFLAKRLNLDWRIGAEWYEYLLTDYDVSSNWGNWQYAAGVGNDPREDRLFNPIKQAHDYDAAAEYMLMWVPEVRGLVGSGGKPSRETFSQICQPWKLTAPEKEKFGLAGKETADRPLYRMNWSAQAGGDATRGNRGGRGARGGRGGHSRGGRHKGNDAY